MARRDAEDYITEYGDTVEKVFFKRKLSTVEIHLKNGNILTYISKSAYSQWCKGRDYYIGPRKYHSGYEIKE